MFIYNVQLLSVFMRQSGVLVSAVILLIISHGLFAKDYYLSHDGNDKNKGTYEQPFKSLKRAGKALRAGDNLFIKGGRYNQPMQVSDLNGSVEQRITIAPVPGETVVMDGTDVLPNNWQLVTPDSDAGKLIQPAQWERLQGKLYSLKLDQPIFSLIHNNSLMSDARWPNARWDDPWRLDRYFVLRRAEYTSQKGRLDDGLTTENTLNESQAWLKYDRSNLKHREENLANLGVSFKDNVVVMSYAWGSWASKITEHKAGENSLFYDTSFEGSGSIKKEALGYLNNRIGWRLANKKFRRSSHSGLQFFVMGLAALDIPQEWWYDNDTQTVYFMPQDGQKPVPGSVRGKRRDFQLTLTDSQYVDVKGFEFFGAGALLEHVKHSTLADSNFRYSSNHKFVVDNFDIPVTTRIENKNNRKTGAASYGNRLQNCTFQYLDGNAFEGRSTGLALDNVLIYQTQQTTLGLDSRSMSIDRPSLVRRVTISDVGASVGIKGGGIDSVYELNNISRFGGLQYDGASLQMGGRQKFIYRYNWSHDHPKRSYRFDSGSFPAYANAFGEMSHNVAWNTPGGFAVKGDDHLIHNNLLVGDGAIELFNMKRWASKNERTLVANNIVPGYSTGFYDWKKPVQKKSKKEDKTIITDTYWMKESPATEAQWKAATELNTRKFDDGTSKRGKPSPLMAVLRSNYLADPNDVLRDPENLDFRPKKQASIIDSGYVLKETDVPWRELPFTGAEKQVNKRDVGPYEFNDSEYWIPGFKYAHASTPVPKFNGVNVKQDADLMWLGGYGAKTHNLYWSINANKVATATTDSPAYKGQFVGKNNIYSFAKPLTKGQKVFWRVDAVDAQGKAIKGDVWSFTVTE